MSCTVHLLVTFQHFNKVSAASVLSPSELMDLMNWKNNGDPLSIFTVDTDTLTSNYTRQG